MSKRELDETMRRLAVQYAKDILGWRMQYKPEPPAPGCSTEAGRRTCDGGNLPCLRCWE